MLTPHAMEAISTLVRARPRPTSAREAIYNAVLEWINIEEGLENKMQSPEIP